MGTSTAGSELHSDKLAKLQARKKELEVLLAAKNEDLYKLCVQEVKLTGIMPPEVPAAAPEVAQDKRGASSSRDLEGVHRKDVTDNARKSRYRHSDKSKDPDGLSRKQMAHRLSTPSISGASTKTNYSNPPRKGEYASANFVSLAHDDGFSLHSSQTYPTLSAERAPSLRESRRAHDAATLPAAHSRHHTITTQHLSKMYYSNERPETQSFSRSHETHFSSSHPDISTHYTHMAASVQAAPPAGTPLLYQYASQLKARSHHLSTVQVAPPALGRKPESRRNTLQRTQTYHLTSHSDYSSHLDGMAAAAAQSSHPHRHPPATLHIPPDPEPLPPTLRRHRSEQSPVHTFQYSPVPLSPQSVSSSRQMGLNHSSNPSLYGSQFVDMQDQKVKEKEWYESSLDSPSDVSAGLNLSRESVQHHSPKKQLQRTPSVPRQLVTQPDGMLPSHAEYPATMTSATTSQSLMTSPSQPFPSGVPFESPKNCTVVESGKWIPYREVTKPFEMSDFYKYSTKFRQGGNATQKPRLAAPLPAPPPTPAANFHPPTEEVISYQTQEQWRHAHQL